ncbi:hypothetical protein B9N66_05850 [Campylobacter concisus]|jgi:hypothetical protein|uniref:hypothetical protein n=1 Tax=Campylobacter concisus TaxID=199 RepID=UPI000B3D5305|nr:hypothetical protein [Campylobacter concisus]OUT09423.1 hypothetical protein B9N66_05850 [Campylobacter concisus]
MKKILFIFFIVFFCSGSFAQVFTYKTDTISINLSTKQIAKDKIKFSLTYENNVYKDIVKISGVARNKNIDLDPETDDDEYGEKLAYFADEYIYEGNGCYLALRIDADENKRAIVNFEECETLNKKEWVPKNMLISKEYFKELKRSK